MQFCGFLIFCSFLSILRFKSVAIFVNVFCIFVTYIFVFSLCIPVLLHPSCVACWPALGRLQPFLRVLGARLLGQPAYTAPGGTNFWTSLGNTHLKIQVYAFIQNKGDVIRRAISSINWACSYERVLSAICFSLCIVQCNVQKAYFEYCKMHSSALTSQQYPLCFHLLVFVCSL